MSSISIDLVRSLATYANILLVSQYVCLLNKKQIFELILLAKYIFYFLIFLGILQFLGFGIIDNVIKFLIPRGSGFSLIESGRGATLLSTEPARAGIELTLIYAIYRLTFLNKYNFRYTDFLLLIFQIMVIKSGSAVLFYIVFLSFLYLNWKSILLIPFFLFFSFHLLISTEGGRASELLISINEMGFDDSSLILFFLINESGNRMLGLYSFFLYGFNHPFGGGIGLWPITSMNAVIESGFDVSKIRFFDVVSDGNLSPFRAPGVISNLMLDFGIAGTILISWLFSRILITYRFLKQYKKTVIVLLSIFLVKIFIFGSPGNPIPFIMLFTVYKYTYFSQKINN